MRRRLLLGVLLLGIATLWGCNLHELEPKGVVALIRAQPDRGRTPLTVEFDGSGSYDPAGPIQDYLWDFGDGSEVASGAKVTHTYGRPGTYLVTLVVTGPSGVGRATCTIHADNTPPSASFTFWPPDPFRNEAVSFDASSSFDPDGEIVEYRWDFGDGSTAEGVTTTHAYGQDGEYLVTLTVVDDSGAEAPASQTVTVSNCHGGNCRR